jgi:hypothetical protein
MDERAHSTTVPTPPYTIPPKTAPSLIRVRPFEAKLNPIKRPNNERIRIPTAVQTRRSSGWSLGWI